MEDKSFTEEELKKRGYRPSVDSFGVVSWVHIDSPLYKPFELPVKALVNPDRMDPITPAEYRRNRRDLEKRTSRPRRPRSDPKVPWVPPLYASHHDVPPPTTKIPTEDWEQRTLIHWRNFYEKSYPDLWGLCHMPLGGFRARRTAATMRLGGARQGYPDLLLDVAVPPYHGLRIELKRTKQGRVADSQVEWGKYLSDRGYLCVVQYGWVQGRACIVEYLSLPSKLLDW